MRTVISVSGVTPPWYDTTANALLVANARAATMTMRYPVAGEVLFMGYFTAGTPAEQSVERRIFESACFGAVSPGQANSCRRA